MTVIDKFGHRLETVSYLHQASSFSSLFPEYFCKAEVASSCGWSDVFGRPRSIPCSPSTHQSNNGRGWLRVYLSRGDFLVWHSLYLSNIVCDRTGVYVTESRNSPQSEHEIKKNMTGRVIFQNMVKPFKESGDGSTWQAFETKLEVLTVE